MHHDQTVSGMADDILGRQAKARAARTGEPLEEALAAVLKTEAGRHLQNLREGPHHNERAADWQENLARERAKERTQLKRPRGECKKEPELLANRIPALLMP